MAVIFPSDILNTTATPLDGKTLFATSVDRDNLPLSVRYKGMQVTVQEFNPPKVYWLPTDDLANTGWVEKTGEGGSFSGDAADVTFESQLPATDLQTDPVPLTSNNVENALDELTERNAAVNNKADTIEKDLVTTNDNLETTNQSLNTVNEAVWGKPESAPDAGDGELGILNGPFGKGKLTNLEESLLQEIANESTARTQALIDEANDRQLQVAASKLNALSFDQANKKLTATLGNDEELSTILPEATSTVAGLMTPADVVALQKAVSDIQSVKEGGVWRATYATKADLESSFPGLDISGTVWTQNDFIYVDSDESRLDLQGKPQSTSYIVTDNGITKTLQFRRVESTSVAQATNNSLGVSKGTPIPTDPNDESADGKQYSENDGSWSTIGWDKLKGRVSANEAVKHSHANKTFLDGLSQSLLDEKVNRVIGWTTPSDPSSINNSLTSIFVAMTVNETKEVHFTSSVMNAFTDAPTGMTSIGNAKITLTRFGATGLLKFTTTNTGGFNWFAALNNMTTTPSINWYRVATNPESISQITASTPTSLLQSLISVALDTPNSSTRIVQFSSASIAGFTDTPPLMTITGTPAMQVTVQRGTNTATIEVALLSASATRSLWKGILITLTTTPAWLQALSLVDMAYPTNDRNNPSTWALNTEINFGDGTFGYRRTGNIVTAANEVKSTTIRSVSNASIIAFGGWAQLGSSSKLGIGCPTVQATFPALETASSVYASTSAIVLQTASIVALSGTTNNAYDVWVRYTKA